MALFFSINPLGSPKYMPPVSSLTIKRSKSDTNSFLIVEAETKYLDKIAGLKLAKKSYSALILNNPFSGFFSEGKSSHLGPPTAPNKIASLQSAFSSVS